MGQGSSTRIKDAGIAIRHSRGYIISILQGLESGVSTKVDPEKRHFSVIEKYSEDVKQDEKHLPDLLESIMRPSCPLAPLGFLEAAPAVDLITA